MSGADFFFKALKMRILESTAIPTERIKPANPGKVRVTPRILYKARVISA